MTKDHWTDISGFLGEGRGLANEYDYIKSRVKVKNWLGVNMKHKISIRVERRENILKFNDQPDEIFRIRFWYSKQKKLAQILLQNTNTYVSGKPLKD